jgi:hypothetical protein
MIPRSFSPRVKWLRCEADNSPPSGNMDKNVWSYISTPSYVFMLWCLVKHKDNFTFTFTFFLLRPLKGVTGLPEVTVRCLYPSMLISILLPGEFMLTSKRSCSEKLHETSFIITLFCSDYTRVYCCYIHSTLKIVA